MQTQNEPNSRDFLLLTIILPVQNGSYEPFHAAMLSFPQGKVQEVVNQIRNPKVLQEILDALEHDPQKLGKTSARMAENGYPKVEILPVEMVGYYQLQTGREGASSGQDEKA